MNTYVREYIENKGYKINTHALEIIEEADDWYRIRETAMHKLATINGETYVIPRMGFAKRAAADDANLCEIISINAGERNDETVHKILDENRFDTQYRRQLELTSAEGTTACYVRLENADVMTDGALQGGDIRLNYVDANGYMPLTVVNDEIIEAAFWGDDFRETEKETTLVMCTRGTDGIYQYETVVFNSDGEASTAEIVRLGEVKPFEVMRVAEVNNIDGMLGYGLPKVYGSIPVFYALDCAFNDLTVDIRDAQKITFLNERICGFDDNGKPIPPNAAQKRRFVFLGEKLPQMDSIIKSESPEIRIGPFKDTIDTLLAFISLKFGYGTKKYSFDRERSEITTAAQYIGERQDMMQELNKQRFQAAQYIRGIIKAALWFENTFRGGSFNLDDEITIEFDDSYVENKAERLESIRQDALAGLGGVYTKVRYLMAKYNLEENEAIKWATTEDVDEEDNEA